MRSMQFGLKAAVLLNFVCCAAAEACEGRYLSVAATIAEAGNNHWGPTSATHWFIVIQHAECREVTIFGDGRLPRGCTTGSCVMASGRISDGDDTDYEMKGGPG